MSLSCCPLPDDLEGEAQLQQDSGNESNPGILLYTDIQNHWSGYSNIMEEPGILKDLQITLVDWTAWNFAAIV